jgi:hypothetical protein
MKLYHCCCFSILTFLYPMYIYYLKPDKNIYEHGCFGVTALAICCNQVFWINPIRFSLRHKIDGVVAKISFFYYFFYVTNKKTLSTAEMNRFYQLVFILGSSFCVSNYFSSKQWCSPRHLICHVIFHCIASRGMMFSFLEE